MACYERRRGASTNNDNASAGSDTPKPSPPKVWACEVCTLENEMTAYSCDACEALRPSLDGDGASSSASSAHATESVKTTSEIVCSICCDLPCQVAFLECGHCVTCQKCANSLMAMPASQCPVCRIRIRKKPLRVYFS